MPDVLWGISCLSLPGPATAAEVVDGFQEALLAQTRGIGGAVGRADKTNTDKAQAHVECYRLVRIEDPASCHLDAGERVVVNLSDSSWGCSDIEDLMWQRHDAELRYDRARESLVSLMESLDFGEVTQTLPSNQDVQPAHKLQMTPQVQQMCKILRQETKVLRYKLNQSEVLRHELQETAEMLRREFMMLVNEIMPRGAPSAASPGDGKLGNGPSKSASMAFGIKVSAATSKEASEALAHTPASARAG